MPPLFPVCRAVLLTGVVACGAASASTLRLDGLLAVNDAPSPCLSVRVKVYEGGRARGEAAVFPDGRVTPLGAKGAAAPIFKKGQSYNLQATCVSTVGAFQNSELNFKAEGRTVMVAFTKTGFQFRRGGVAY